MEIVRALPAAARLPLRVYRSLFPVAFTLMLPGVLARMFRRGSYRHKFGHRLGLYSPEDRARLEPGGWTWIHSGCGGAMMVGITLARPLMAARPALRVLISTTTSTRYAVAREPVAEGGDRFELGY